MFDHGDEDLMSSFLSIAGPILEVRAAGAAPAARRHRALTCVHALHQRSQLFHSANVKVEGSEFSGACVCV